MEQREGYTTSPVPDILPMREVDDRKQPLDG